MVHVRVHRPVREHHVGIGGGEDSTHRVYLRSGHFGGAVDLAEGRWLRADDLAGGLTLGGANLRRFLQRLRSEERRVGEECRSRWAPYHLKKKKEKRRLV